MSQAPLPARELFEHLRSGSIDLSKVARWLAACTEAANVCEESFGWAPLLFAANAGNVKLLSLLFDARADVHTRCLYGNTALHLAARAGHLHATNAIIDKGADLEDQNAHGWTPLIWSAIVGHQSIASMLLENGAQIGAVDECGRTALMWTARHGHLDLVKTLVGLGVDLSEKDGGGLTVRDHALHYAEARRSILAMDSGRKAPLEDDERSALYWSTEAGSLDMSRLLAQHGSLPSKPSTPSTTTPAPAVSLRTEDHELIVEAIDEALAASEILLAAAKAHNWEATEKALRAGACASSRNGPDQMSSLMYTGLYDAPAAAMMLIASRASTEGRDRIGWTALHYAVHSHSYNTVSVLHYLGADFTARSGHGDSALHFATRGDDGPMVQLLGQAKPDLEERDAEGLTPLQIAVVRGCAAALRSLLALRADVTVKDIAERSVFALGAAHGQSSVLSTLLEPLRPPTPRWREDAIAETLERLPWVSTEADEQRRFSAFSLGGQSLLGFGASVASLGSAGCATSVASVPAMRNKKTKRSGQRQTGMQTIQEVDAETLDGSAIGAPIVQRPVSRGSDGSHCTRNGSRSNVTRVASALSKVSAQSKAVSNGDHEARSQASSFGQPSLHSATSRRSRASAQGKHIVNPFVNSPVDLLWEAYAAGTCAQDTNACMAPVTAKAALSSADACGRTPLSLAAYFGHRDVVSSLVAWNAQTDVTDNEGATALMLAAVGGDCVVVQYLLNARAKVDIRNATGQTAVEVAANAELRRLIQGQADRDIVERSLVRSSSLPSLVKAPERVAAEQRTSAYRLRLDSLPPLLNAVHVEAHVRKMLKTSGAPRPLNVDVVLDPITMQPRGHAYVDFSTAKLAEQAAECLDSGDEDE